MMRLDVAVLVGLVCRAFRLRWLDMLRWHTIFDVSSSEFRLVVNVGSILEYQDAVIRFASLSRLSVCT